MAHSRWDNANILHIPEVEKNKEMHYRFVREDNVKKLNGQGYKKVSNDKTSNISEPKRNEFVIMQISEKDAEDKRKYFRSKHQEKITADRERQEEMSKTVMTPQGRRLTK